MTLEELAQHLRDAGRHHHQAFAASDGTDPEWALWYAGWLQARIWDRAGPLPTRSRLVHLLLSAEAAHAAAGGDTPWAESYAAWMLPQLQAG